MDENTRKTMFSKDSDEWETPQEFFDKLNKEFEFTLDPCSTDDNHKCEKYYTKENDGLSKSWVNEVVFVNPPYSKTKDWLKKAYEETRNIFSDTIVAMLIPSRTDTKYFHDYCLKADEIRFIKGRLKFGNQKNSAPFPSMVVVFYANNLTKVKRNLPQISRMERK